MLRARTGWSRRLFSALGLLTALSATSPAQADDWLALYPECGFGPEARALGRMAMIYPRPGLPAVVEVGQRLVTRVRVPSGLTPPPGIQKDRALRGWSAELVGQSVGLGDGGEHRYRTRVVDVRPDGQSTLVYRASIEIPRWAAPGTYGIRMSAPGGSDAVAGALRIIEAGSVPVLHRLAGDALPAPEEHDAYLASLAASTADVVVAEDERLLGALSSAAPGAHVPALLISSEHLPVVLRVGSEALLFGSCDDRYAPFSMQLEGIARREGRQTRRFSNVLAELETSVPGSAPTVTRTGGGLEIRASDARAAELTVHYADDGRGVSIEGGEASFYPGVSIPMTGAVRTIAMRVSLDAGQGVTLSRSDAAEPGASMSVSPDSPVSGDTVSMRVEPAGLALVAWRLEEDLTLVGPEITHAYRPVGEQRIHAFVISEAGVGQALSATVQVETREVRGCGSCVSGGDLGPSAVDLWLIPLILLRMGIRRRNRPSSWRR